VTVSAINAVERGEIHRVHRLKHRPNEVILRQPLPQRRRHQKHLVPVRGDEVLSHLESVLKPPDDQTRIYPTATDLPDTDARGAFITAERIRTCLAVVDPLMLEGSGLPPVTVTAGGAVWTAGDLDDLIIRADRALYAGKDAGRDIVRIGEAEMKADPPVLKPSPAVMGFS
jgi:hypothetical protein